MAELTMRRAMRERTQRQNQLLDDQAKRDINRVLDQAGPMQSNSRLQRLLQLAREKHCQ